jgi:hypothetical protein
VALSRAFVRSSEISRVMAFGHRSDHWQVRL